jgi:hypothetical protein
MRRLTLDRILLFIALVLANLRALIFIFLFPDPRLLFGPAWIEISLWFLVTLGVVYVLIREDRIVDYLLAWKANWLVGLFLFLALISVFWSLDSVVTLFRALELLFATIIAAYIGIRFQQAQLMEILFWFGTILLILSIAIVLAVPKTGTMYWAPFDGAWRGIYWHRNHLGSITALINIVYFCRAIMAFERRDKVGYLDGFFYILSLIVLYFAESASGYILFIFLHFLIFCIWLWLKVSHRLQRQHYYVIFGVFSAGLVLILSNLEFVFGLFNRSTTLTGRVGLWNYLLRDVVSQRLWWGHGFGAVWTLDSFREEVRKHVGWASQPLIADNGFLEILLHVGAVGLLLFIGILLILLVRSFQYAISQKTLVGFFPLLFLLYALLANIPFSLFAETEVFVWLLLVSIIFMISPREHFKDKKIEGASLA